MFCCSCFQHKEKIAAGKPGLAVFTATGILLNIACRLCCLEMPTHHLHIYCEIKAIVEYIKAAVINSDVNIRNDLVFSEAEQIS